MTLNPEDRNELIKYRIQQADECVEEVKFLIENKRYKIAVNRIYYGMFYMHASIGIETTI